MTFRFLYPAVLLLLILPVIVWYLTSRRGICRESPLLFYSDLRLIDGLPTGWRVRFRWLPNALRLGAWMLLIIALARPQGGQSQQVIRGQGIDIVLALDISSSMAALDFAPNNRLEAAKRVISSFIAGRDFDRIGLVVFAQNAYQQVPPTLDYAVLTTSLDQIQLAPELSVDDGTAIGLGIASAGNMLRTSDAASKIIILLTDGANNAGRIGPVTAAEAVDAFGIRVYTIGIGKSGMVPVPIDDQGNTTVTESDLDEATLQAIARATDGQYFRAEDMPDLQQVYDQIDRLERSEVQRQVVVNWQEQSEIILWVALAALVAERLLRHTLFETIP
jgi:Ca-activated chloride channel family protein